MKKIIFVLLFLGMFYTSKAEEKWCGHHYVCFCSSDYPDDDDDDSGDDDDDDDNGLSGGLDPDNPVPISTHWYFLFGAGSLLGGYFYWKMNNKTETE